MLASFLRSTVSTPFFAPSIYSTIATRALATSATASSTTAAVATKVAAKNVLTEDDIIPPKPEVKPRKRPSQMTRPSEPLVS